MVVYSFYFYFNILESCIANYSYFNFFLLRSYYIKSINKALRKLDLWGMGHQWNNDWWKAFIRLLISEGMLRMKPLPKSFGSVLEYTPKGRDWYKKFRKMGSQ